MQDFARRATYADLEAVPPHLVAELIDGVLTAMPRPAPRHARASSVLGGVLVSPFDRGVGGPGGWWILDEPELHVAQPADRSGASIDAIDVVVPDLAGWRRERMAVLPETAWFELAPDWVCEVLSPSTRAHDLGPKRRVYARAGVTHLWQVDPIAQVIESFALHDGQWLLLETVTGDAEAALAPFAAVPFRIGDLWA